MAERFRFLKNRSFPRSASGRPKATTRHQRARLHLEQLEPRMLMNADNNPAPLEAIVTLSQFQPIITVPSIPIVTAPFIPVDQVMLDDVSYSGWNRTSPKDLPASPQDGFQSMQQLREWLIEAIDSEYGDLFGTTYNSQNEWSCVRDIDVIRAMPTFTLANDTSGTSFSYSGTNVQVEGVDEADLIETDGKYLYLVSGKELIIVDASDGEDLSLVSRVKLQNRPTGIYLAEDRLTLISSNSSTPGFRYHSYSGSRIATTTVTVLDISDPSSPSQVQKTEFKGNLVSSRMVDGQLRIVLSHQRQAILLPELKINTTFNNELGNSKIAKESGLAVSTYETRSEYLDRVLDVLVGSILQTYRTISASGELIDEIPLVPIDEVEIPDSRKGFTKTIIATFDIHSNNAGPTGVKTLFTDRATEIYSTQDHLYVFGQTYQNYNHTSIWKFDFNSAGQSINLAAKGKVVGNVLNQFSIDEHDGFLRIVTKEHSWRSGQTLVVLEQAGENLLEVGRTESLAPGERLHSVRFMGDRAFAVTYRIVDPLFAIDLSDPTNPTIAGELKIPGYSDYLQPIGSNHLLGIGRDAPAEGGLFQELQLSIFDVSDLDDPQLAHRFSFAGGRSTASITTGGRWTRGDGDHHAVSYFPSEQLLAIPIHAEDSMGGIFAQGQGGLQVFSVDTSTGFESLALIEHDSPILRSLRIGNKLIAYSAGEITSHELTGSINQLDSLQLSIGSDIGLIELSAYNPLAPADVWLAYTTLPSLEAVEREQQISTALDLTSTVQTPILKASLDVIVNGNLHLSPDYAEAADLAFTSLEESANAKEFSLSLEHEFFEDLLQQA